MKAWHIQIVQNLKRNNPELQKYSDKAILDAWSVWSNSEDFPDEKAIIHWVEIETKE